LRIFEFLMLGYIHIVDNRSVSMLIKVQKLGTLADLATHRLAQSIVSGELAQGQKLNEVELAERFGMGRGPLREALRHLEGMRLVKRIPNAGARVVVLDKKMLADLYAVREALEGMACRIAATVMTDEEITQLSALLDDHERQIQKQGGKVYTQSEGDLDFHYQIARGSRNQMLMDLLGSEQYQLLRMCRHQTSRSEIRTRPALQQHRQIVDALAQRDGELAEMLMRRHIQGASRSINEMINQEEAA
jgi:DNA-binding GntR family transcriptional regulator